MHLQARGRTCAQRIYIYIYIVFFVWFVLFCIYLHVCMHTRTHTYIHIVAEKPTGSWYWVVNTIKCKHYTGTSARLHNTVRVVASRPAPAKSTGVQYEQKCEYCTGKWIKSSRKRVNHFYTRQYTVQRTNQLVGWRTPHTQWPATRTRSQHCKQQSCALWAKYTDAGNTVRPIGNSPRDPVE